MQLVLSITLHLFFLLSPNNLCSSSYSFQLPLKRISHSATTTTYNMNLGGGHQNDGKGHNFSPDAIHTEKSDVSLPTMIVFDLDDCLWSPEMYTLSARPSIPIRGTLSVTDFNPEVGVVGMRVPNGGPVVKLFDGARRVLRELALNPKYRGVILAAASSSEEPTYSMACLRGIEILKGLTMRDMFRYDQIGQTGTLTSRKITHFKELHRESGIAYNEMLFFDDCNWGDHCADVTKHFGVVSQKTPRGMQYSEFCAGLEKYKKEAKARGVTTS